MPTPLGCTPQSIRTVDQHIGCAARWIACARAADVDPVPANAARRPRRRRGRQPPPAGARRLHPPGRAGRVHVAAARLDRLPQRRADRPRGDGPRRLPGGPLPGAAPPRAVRGHRPVDRLRRQHVPPAGPAGQRLPPRPDARGDVHAAGEGPVLVVQGPAAVDLPDPDEVPRRGPAPGRAPARPGVRDEGLLQLRHRRRGTRAVVPAPPRRLHPHVRSPRPALRDRVGDVRGDGRFGQRGVPGARRRRRGHVRAHGVGLVRGERRGGAHPRTRSSAVRRRPGRRRPRHAGHADDRHARRPPQCPPRAAPARTASGRRPTR